MVIVSSPSRNERQASLQSLGKLKDILGLTLPNRLDDPTIGLEFASHTEIAVDVCRKLGCPKGSPSLRHCRLFASGVTMPKATVNEYDGAMFRKNNIGCSGKRWVMKPKTKTKPV
jgi:hypothetical protein